PLNPGWHQQGGLIIRARERHAMRPRDAMTLPFANGQLPAAIGEHEIEIRRHHDFVAPGLPWTPSDTFQIVGGRSDEVGHRIDDVAAAVTVEIDSIALEGGRHELRRPEG